MKVLLFIYQWLIAAPILLLATILASLSTIAGVFHGSKKWAPYYPSKIWAKIFCIVMFVRIEVRGRENIDKNTSYVFIANHQGAYDIFTVYGYLNHHFRWMMKKSLEKVPFVGIACKKAGHIMVDRSSASSIKKTMDEAKDKLKDGLSLVIFPEGARSWNGKMRQFKRGAFKLATEFHLPIVPMTIDGSFEVLPRTTYNIKPGKIILTIHKPITISDEDNDCDKVMEISYNSIQSALPEKYKNK